MSYKFLLFDLDHTLLDFDAAEDVALTRLFVQYGVEDLDSYKAIYGPLNKGLWRDLEQGLIAKKDLVNTRFSRLFAHFGQVLDGVELAKSYEHHLSQQGQTYTGAEDLLVTLKTRGYRLFAATNGIGAIQRGRLQASGLETYFEEVFISEELGAAKPQLAFFEKIAERIDGFEPDKAVMIGDSLTADIPGGLAAGFRTIWVNLHGLDNTSSHSPHHEVHSYEELKNLLL